MFSNTSTKVAETLNEVSVTADMDGAGQVVSIGGDTFEVAISNLDHLAIEYQIGGGEWVRLGRGKTRRLEANLQYQTLRLRKGADVNGGLRALVTAYSSRGSFPPEKGEELQRFRVGGRTVLFGSSTMERHWENNGAGGINRLALSAKGPFTWLNAMLDNRFQLVRNLGVGGQTTAQILARVNDVFAYDPDIVWYHAGTNDVFQSGLQASVAFANARAAVEVFLARGIRVVLCLPQKWNSSDTDVNASKTAQYFKYLDLLADYGRTTPGVFVANFPAGVVDATDANGNQLANHYEDTKHLSNLGAYKVAKALRDGLDLFTRDILPRPDEQENLLADPYMTATKAATNPVTGTVWNSYTVTRSAGTPTVACSVVGAPDGRGFAQRIQITATASNDRVNVEIPTALVFPLVAVGDLVQFEVDVYIASSAALRAIPAYMVRNSGTLNIIGLGRDLNTTANDKALPNEAIRLTIQTPPWRVSEGTTAMNAVVAMLFNGAGNADVYLWRPRLRKVPSATLAY